MKMKYLAVALSALTFSQTVLATAPLCRSVLRSLTQEQVNAAIEDFTRLTLKSDEAQAAGNLTALSYSLRLSQKEKERELLHILNLSREELKNLVSEQITAIRTKNGSDKDLETKTREAHSNVELGVHKLTHHFDASLKSGYRYRIFDNSTKLYTMERPGEVFSLTTGEFEAAVINDILIGSKTVIAENRAGKEVLFFRDLNTSEETMIPALDNSKKIASADGQSLAVLQTIKGKPYQYQLFDLNGKLIHQGADPLNGNSKDFALLYAGTKKWILKNGDKPLILLDPQNQTVKVLPIQGSTLVPLKGTNKVAITRNFELHVLDLDTNSIETRRFDQPIDVHLADKHLLWVGSWNGLSKVDAHTLETLDFAKVNSLTTELKSIDGTDLLAINTPNDWGLVSGIYAASDLTKPKFNLFEYYEMQDKQLYRQIASDDGNVIVVEGHDKEMKNFVDVWRLK